MRVRPLCILILGGSQLRQTGAQGAEPPQITLRGLDGCAARAFHQRPSLFIPVRGVLWWDSDEHVPECVFYGKDAVRGTGNPAAAGLVVCIRIEALALGGLVVFD